MKKFAVFGLGNFGFSVAKALYEEGHEVLCVDREEARVNKIQEFATHTIIGDVTDRSLLESAGIADMDAVIVSLGDNLSASILTTLYLKDLSVKNILVKIRSEDHGRILEKIGADEVIFPEKETAIKIAKSLSNPNILDYIPLSPEYSILEVAPPNRFIGKTLSEINLRAKYGVNVIAIRELVPDRLTMAPGGDFVIKDSDIFIVLGRPEDIAKIQD